jgi:site-specific DNA-methyltransferase (adenine-specific)/site-specific DNA-methyltransferase (cytosine-N4-specific)
LEVLRVIPAGSVRAVITSPPYAKQRKYSSVPEEEYVDWFIPIAEQIKRILTPDGNFLLNLKAHCRDGERSLYVYDLLIRLKSLGFYLQDELVWYKSALPRKYEKRLKNCWEPIYQLSVSKNNFLNVNEIKVPTKYAFQNKNGWSDKNGNGNCGGYHGIAQQGAGTTVPSNLLYFPTSLLGKDRQYPHPAKFPVELAEFLIRCFSEKGDWIVDPFLGSGTVAAAALRAGRRVIGIDKEKEYVRIAKERVTEIWYN